MIYCICGPIKFILGTFVVIGLYVYEFLCLNFLMWFMAGEIATTMNPSQGAHPKGIHPIGITSMPNS